ncbi:MULTISPECIES: MFS transporter [unclassified Bradyrhizobium]|uniref:MFS transporter n=1 Tax=unclassified Bradyrhizobium TaxID=2631580 RepID=UPI002306A2C0|nr:MULTISPECIES: MFS transporter [unclassified Bradyrhizobium]MDA9451205.1 MFS transporter [Bradyrhizobium sp. CCBAU 21360]MDA9457584.1 MFS transporter [Bradyrhizobium sp. CCBAU 21359]
MLSNVLAPVLAKRDIHYGWVVVAVAFVTMLATAAAMGMPGVLLLPLKNEFGWDLGLISGALALRLALFGLVGPFAAALMHRYGLRRVVSIALAAISIGLGLATQMTALWQLWVTWGILLGLSTGITANVLGATIATRWFAKSRGLVVGILSASTATGQLLFLPAAAWLADHLGWRMAMLPAGITCLICLGLVLLFIRDYPSHVGLPAYGDEKLFHPRDPKADGNVLITSFKTLGVASRNVNFWILAGTFFICGLSTSGLIQNHFIPFCHDYGLDSVTASGVLALIGACDFIGTIGSGWLSDRFDSRWLLFWYYGLRGLSLVLLPYSDFSFYGLSLFAVFYGLDWIATIPPTVKLTGEQFGREKGPLVFGWIFTAHQIGAATAAFGAGFTREAFASYLPAFMAAGAMCIIAAAAIILVQRRSTEEALAT